jgi:hypothetical protein
LSSSERRAYEIDDSALISAPTIYKTPGPGAYDVASAPRVSSKKGQQVIVPFSSTMTRYLSTLRFQDLKPSSSLNFLRRRVLTSKAEVYARYVMACIPALRDLDS